MKNEEKKKNKEHKIKINLTKPPNPNEPDLHRMVHAFLESGNSIIIPGQRIDSVEVDGKRVDYEIAFIELLPGQSIILNIMARKTDCGFNNIDFRYYKKDELLIFSTDERCYPYKIGFDYDPENKSGEFHLEIDDDADVKQILKWEKLLRTLNNEGIICLFNSEKNREFFVARIPKINVVDDEFYDILRKLTIIQKYYGKKLFINEGIKNEDILNADKIIEMIETGSISLSVEDFEGTFTVKEVKRMLKEQKKKLPIIYPNYSLKVLDEDIELGDVIIYQKLQILNKSDIKVKISKLKDDENIIIKLKPKNEDLKLLKPNDKLKIIIPQTPVPPSNPDEIP